ncbi:hypothetical protein D3C78_1683370 [compost metagenome]
MLLEQCGKAQQDFLALLGGALRPDAAVESAPRGLDGKVDVCGLARDDLVEHPAIAGRNIVEGFATLGIDKAAIDKCLAQQCEVAGTLLDAGEVNEIGKAHDSLHSYMMHH